MDETLEEAARAADGAPSAEKTSSQKSGERYRLLHDVIADSSLNYHALIALAAMAMARAQGRLQRGPDVRRQAILAMAQGLYSAGYPHTLSSMQVMFAEMQLGGLFTVVRSGEGKNGTVVDIDFAMPKKMLRRRGAIGKLFTLNWSRRTSRDVETHPMLLMSVTPQAEGASATAKEAEARLAAASEAQEEAAAEAERAAAMAARPAAAPMRSFWADEGGETFDTYG